MSEPSRAYQWQVASDLSGSRMRVCLLCGKAEKDPAWKVIFTAEKPMIPGWYWYRINSKEAEPVVVHVLPQLDRVGTGGGGDFKEAKPSDGGAGQALREAEEIGIGAIQESVKGPTTFTLMREGN
jgi:hypothetical protein